MEPAGIDGAWVFTPRIFHDTRGHFLECFHAAELSAVLGYRPDVAQANCSVSRRGVIRGIHFADVPPGQAKYVCCASGAILDVIVDVRVGSPGYGRWAAEARASRSPPALAAEYGELGSSAARSVQEPDSTLPYTSSVETWTTGSTPASRHACRSTCTPATLVATNGAAPLIERST